MNREELIAKLGTKEDGKFSLYDLEELEKLIKAGNNKEDWYCIGRKNEKEKINYCIHSYSAFNNKGPVKGCTADCKFYKDLHGA